VRNEKRKEQSSQQARSSIRLTQQRAGSLEQVSVCVCEYDINGEIEGISSGRNSPRKAHAKFLTLARASRARREPRDGPAAAATTDGPQVDRDLRVQMFALAPPPWRRPSPSLFCLFPNDLRRRRRRDDQQVALSCVFDRRAGNMVFQDENKPKNMAAGGCAPRWLCVVRRRLLSIVVAVVAVVVAVAGAAAPADRTALLRPRLRARHPESSPKSIWRQRRRRLLAGQQNHQRNQRLA
jgi:hypothetical protein